MLILAYHNIRRDGAEPAGDRSLHLPLGAFRQQLDLLARDCEVISLPQALAPGNGRPRVAITFDDAYRGALRLGVPELVSRGLPATIFVAPGLLGGRTFWWDVLAGPEGLPEAVRTQSLEALRGQDAAVREWAGRQQLALAEPPEDCRGAEESELAAAASAPGITLGCHTWSHPNLARLAHEELAGELARPLQWLRQRYGERVLPWISYPYGRWSPPVAEAARVAGFVAGLRVEGGWHRCGAPDRFGIPRLNVPAGLSGNGFRLRLAGLFCR